MWRQSTNDHFERGDFEFEGEWRGQEKNWEMRVGVM